MYIRSKCISCLSINYIVEPIDYGDKLYVYKCWNCGIIQSLDDVAAGMPIYVLDGQSTKELENNG